MRRALIIWGGWDGHEPEACAATYRRWLKADGFAVQVEAGPEAFGDPNLKDFSLIVPICTAARIDPTHARNFADAVALGVGVAGHHGGMSDAFRDSPEYQSVIGGHWVAHPGGIIDFQIEVTKPEDPIVQGVPRSFTYRSEQYYMHMDPTVEVLATTRFTGEHAAWTRDAIMPVVWKRHYAEGRVFHCTLGHAAAELENPDLEKILRRGINWAARRS